MIEERLREAGEIFETRGAVRRLERLTDSFEPPLGLVSSSLVARFAIEAARWSLAQDASKRVVEPPGR